MSLRIAIVVGNPKPKSRTLKVALKLTEELLSGVAHATTVIDLADHADNIFAWPSAEMSELNEKVANSDLVVFASPTYKATYSGLLKAFLDRYPADGLAGVVAIPLLTGADAQHSMGPTFTLAPLLTELGAIVPGRGLYFVIEHMDRVDDIVKVAAAGYRESLERLARIGSSLLTGTTGGAR